MPASAPFPELELLGMRIAVLDTHALLDHLFAELRDGRGGWVVTANLDILRRAVLDSDARALYGNADLICADGMPLVWASKLAGNPLPERVAGSDLVWHICQRAAQRNYSVFLLGGDEGVADKAARVLRMKYQGLRVADTHCPPFGFEKNPKEMDAIRTKLSDAKPDIVLVALGCPKQERLIDTLRNDFPDSWFFGIGISLSFVTGDVKRAPTLIRRLGLEWVHRLLQEPGRLAKRYILVGIPFACRVLTGSVLARFRG